MKPWIVAVHGGAGFHSLSSEKAVKHALRQACSNAHSNGTHSALQVVEEAIVVLENDICLNAGYGSNLTIDGKVEGDASIIDGITESFGSVGAVQGIKNPVRLARAVLENQKIPQPLGRVPPLTLVGLGAASFAIECGLGIVDPTSLISPEAHCEWTKWKGRLQNATSSEESAQPPSDVSYLEDTVGAIACDETGSLAAGVSSGGLLLKYPGRMGEAAVFGAGAFASSPPGASFGVACSVSGTGEQIIRADLARSLSNVLCASPDDTHTIIQETLERFSASCAQRGEDNPCAGVLVLTKEHEEDSGDYILRLWCAFTTASMAIAYVSSLDPQPRALILRHPKHVQGGNSGGPMVFVTLLPLTRD